MGWGNQDDEEKPFIPPLTYEGIDKKNLVHPSLRRGPLLTCVRNSVQEYSFQGAQAHSLVQVWLFSVLLIDLGLHHVL